jgi:hypothetical protein
MAPTAGDNECFGYTTPFASPAAQRGDTEREADSDAVVTLTAAPKPGGRGKGCIPRVDSLVLAEQRLAHCKRHERHVPDQLHAREELPRSMFKRAIRSIRGALHLSARS